jgi:hypothetical protein
MRAMALVLSARVILTIAIGGAIYLTLISGGDPYKLIGLLIYCVSAVGGTIYLAAHQD